MSRKAATSSGMWFRASRVMTRRALHLDGTEVVVDGLAHFTNLLRGRE